MQPRKPDDGSREATTYFQLERARRQLDEPSENEPGDIPPLPASSPWHHDPCGDEPLIDRSEDK
jgi:hypothetical protein